jgi:hypothetical protein
MTNNNENNAKLSIDIQDDNCVVNLEGNTDILLSGIVAAIHAIIKQLMLDYDENDFDTEGMNETDFEFCITAMVLAYIMDNFDDAVKEIRQDVEELEESNDTPIVPNENINSLNFNVFENSEDNND